MNTKQFFLALCLVCTLSAASQIVAQEDSPKDSGAAEKVNYSVQGKIHMPPEVPEAINTEGLSVDKVVITLKGQYNHPQWPRPEGWGKMSSDERKACYHDFLDSDAHEAFLRKVEDARSKRKVYKTEIEKDGSFVFSNVTPAWYELTADIMHPSAGDEHSQELARARVMHQFFVRENKKEVNFNLTLKLKNVLVPGDQAPDWTATAYDGSEFKLSDFRGKYVLFDFWATWCGPCRAEFPNMESVFKKHGSERFEMIGLSVDETIDAARKVLKETPLAYRQGWVGDLKRHEEIAEAYGFQAIPSIWLIGPDGKIIARDLHGKKLRAAVDAALKDEPAK